MTASASETSGDVSAERAPAGQGPARLNRLAGAAAPIGIAAVEPGAEFPALRDFLGSEDDRLRDMLTFAMAVETGKPPAPDGIAALRRKADADLHDYAFRLLHNQVEEIRRQAVAEQVDRAPRPPGFGGLVLANLTALALVGLLAVVTLALDPTMPARLGQLLTSLSGGA